MSMRTARAASIVMLAGLGLAAGPARAQIVETPETKIIPRLTVQGEAELRKPADQLQLSVEVITEDVEAGRALNENNRRMTAVTAALEKAGLQKDEYETARFRIRPEYSRRPRQAGPDWQPQITGYNVTNSLQVRTKRLELAGGLIQAANEAGANSIGDIAFDLADPRRYRGEAIARATRHARDDAEALAAAAGVRLVRLLSVDLDDPGRPVMARGRALAEGVAATPVSPGDVTVSATVTLVYEIAGSGDDEHRGEHDPGADHDRDPDRPR